MAKKRLTTYLNPRYIRHPRLEGDLALDKGQIYRFQAVNGDKYGPTSGASWPIPRRRPGSRGELELTSTMPTLDQLSRSIH
jgi:hypothetical protein